MNITEIKDLMESFDKSGCSSFEVQQADFTIRLEKNIHCSSKVVESLPAEVVEAQTVESLPVVQVEKKAETEPDGELVKAPLVGVFYAAANPDAEAFVQVGSRVEEGQVLCLIEAMKMMSEITATKSGVIKKIYVKNQDIVGFEDPLFLIGD